MDYNVTTGVGETWYALTSMKEEMNISTKLQRNLHNNNLTVTWQRTQEQDKRCNILPTKHDWIPSGLWLQNSNLNMTSILHPLEAHHDVMAQQSCPNPFKLRERSRCKGVVDAKSQQQGSFTFRNSVGSRPVHRLHQRQKLPFCFVIKTQAARWFLVFLLLLQGELRKIPGKEKEQVCCAFLDPDIVQYLLNYPAAPTSVTALIWHIRAFLPPDWWRWRSPLKHVLLRWSPIGLVLMQPIRNPCPTINWNSSLVDPLQLYWWFAKAINWFFPLLNPLLLYSWFAEAIQKPGRELAGARTKPPICNSKA